MFPPLQSQPEPIVPAGKPASLPPAGPPATPPAKGPAPASKDDYQPTGRPENWRVENVTTHQMVERVRQAQGKELREAGQKITEDSKQTNLDTGEVIQMHAEETVTGKASEARQDFRQFDARGQLRTESVTQAVDDGAGHAHGSEVVSRFAADGARTERTRYEWTKEQGKLVHEATTEEK